MSWALSPAVLALLGACVAEPPPTPTLTPTDVGGQCTVPTVPEVPAAADCGASVPVLEAGREVGRVCVADAPRYGLTILDLSDDWVPLVFRDPDNLVQLPQPFRGTYVALANEEYPPGPEGDRARHDAFLELYGISPSFRVLAERLLEEERHQCHAAVDPAPIEALTATLQPSRPSSRRRRGPRSPRSSSGWSASGSCLLEPAAAVAESRKRSRPISGSTRSSLAASWIARPGKRSPRTAVSWISGPSSARCGRA